MKKAIIVLMAVPFLFISACGKGKEGANKGGVEAPLAATAPITPSGISTVAGNGAVTVRWAASPGSDSYNVYFSEKAGEPLEKAAKVTGIKDTSYDHKEAKNGSIYYYRISAVNKAGESPLSGETGAMPKATPPAVPTGVAAVGGTGFISVKWNTVVGATLYNVYFSTKPQVAKDKRTKVSDVKAPPYEHKDVKKKTMYFYVVSAVNAGGEGPLSAESGAMP